MSILRGYVYALISITGFATTFIGIALGKAGFDPIIMSAGRILPAAIGALIALKLNKQTLLPPKESRKWVALLSLGIVIAFPMLSTFAMQSISAADAGVIVAVTPLMTAIVAVLLGHRHPKRIFWVAAVLGTFAAVIFALSRSHSVGGGELWGYLLMIAAVICSSFGSVAGGTMAGRHQPFFVISWAIVMATPVLVPITLFDLATHPIAAWPPASAWFGYLWVSLFSIFIGHFFWNSAMHAVGIIKISQMQLAQPLITMLLSLLILNEAVSPTTLVAALAIIGCVAWTQRIK
jgi:drug/metabolite transporter (DMT)-like permease